MSRKDPSVDLKKNLTQLNRQVTDAINAYATALVDWEKRPSEETAQTVRDTRSVLESTRQRRDALQKRLEPER